MGIRCVLYVALGSTLLGCADQITGATAPNSIPGPRREAFPEGIPPEYDVRPSIWNQRTTIAPPAFSRSNALVIGQMSYFGTGGDQVVTAKLISDTGEELNTETVNEEDRSLLPGNGFMATNVRIFVPSLCGHAVVGQTQHGAVVAIPTGWGYIELSRVRKVTRDDLMFTTCGEDPCSGDGTDTSLQPSVYDASYEPYGAPSSGGGCGSGGDAGSGIQYQPGDNTGGETVDWGTGVGNGGKSACGVEAVVEYVCIDIYTDDGWQQWSCGYATTC